MVLSFVYLLLAKILYDRKRENLRLLVESFLALGMVFATLAIPMALDGRWTSASWALEGAAILWMGVRQQKLLPRVAGIALQFAAGFALLLDFHFSYAAWPVVNSVFVGGLILAMSGLFSAWYLQHHKSSVKAFEYMLSYVLFAWGLMWWLLTALREIDRFVPYTYVSLAWLLFFTFTAALFSILQRRLLWSVAKFPALALLPVMLLLTLQQWLQPWHQLGHPFAEFAGIGWLAAFVTAYWLVRRYEQELAIEFAHYYQAGLLWLLTFILSWELAWIIDYLVQGQGVWPLIAWALVPGLMLGGLSVFGKKIRWPVAQYLPVYLGMIAIPVAIYLWLWTLFSNFSSDGNPYPLQYLPLLNPLDMVQIFVFMVLLFWLQSVRSQQLKLFENVSLNGLYAAMGVAVFVWLNAVLLRTMHYWADVAYTWYAMTNSLLVQASVSIFWSLLALLLMRVATHRQWRTLWITGGVLMAAVVIKLFTVDISGGDTLTRIVSFIGVAVLMLIMGYVAPIPSAKKETLHD